MDVLQRMGNPHDFDRVAPDWATCGSCNLCVKGDIVGHVRDKAARMWIEATVGICNDENEPVIVDLDTGKEDMPCNGESWEG